MTQHDAPSRPHVTTTSGSTVRSWRRLGMPHVLRLGRLRSAVPAATGAPAPRRRRITRRWGIAGGVALAVLVAFGLWVVLASPWLVARTVHVVGATAATRDQVEQVAAVPLGTPLARVPLGDIADRVRGITSVDEVTVTRSWPGTVTITVTQATPAALMRDGSGYALVSDTGEPYRTVASRPSGLPLAAAQVSQLSDDAAARAALDVAVEIGSTDSAVLWRLVDTVRASSPLQVTVMLRDGTPVTWGSPVGSQVKARALLLLLQANPQASAYDVSAPTTPSITP
jgi:cell division protein FtsQ